MTTQAVARDGRSGRAALLEAMPFVAGGDLGFDPGGEGLEDLAIGGLEAEDGGGPFEVWHGDAGDEGAGGGDVEVGLAGAWV